MAATVTLTRLERLIAASTLLAAAIGLARRPPATEAAGVRGAPAPAELDRLTADEPPTGFRARIDAAASHVPGLPRALQVKDRYGALHGDNLAAAVTFQAFVALFPLLLVAVAVVGFIAGNGTDVAGKLIGELGLTGDAAEQMTEAIRTASGTAKAASVIGVLGLLWSGLGLVSALQYGYDQAWQVEARGIKDKAVGLAWLVGAAVLLVATSAATTVVGFLPGIFAPLGIAVGLATSFALWLWTGRVLPNVDLPWRSAVPGAIVGAIGLEVLKVVGGIYVPRAVQSSSALYGSLGVVFAILAWLYLFGRLVIYTAVVNVVFHERRAGTVTVVAEVPRQPGATTGEEVTRMGRLTDA